MRRDLWAAVLGVGAVSIGCQTLTEEMPTRSSTVNPAPAPVVIVQVPVPPNVPPPQQQQPANPAPAPAPTPTVRPAPTPAPVNTLPPQDGDFPNNNAPVTKLGAKVFYVECNGSVLPDSEHAREVQLGCRIHYDCTPKDAQNRPTRAKGTPQWDFRPGGMVSVAGRNPYTPVATTLRRGEVCAQAEVDGVRSNEVCVNIR